MKIQAHKNLQDLHTFGVPWKADVFCAVDNVENAVKTVLYAIEQKMDMLVLGGGSNILPTENFKGLVIKNEICGRTVTDENDQTITVDVGAGEVWHDLVLWCTEHGYYGLENLALIPGTVGGAVVQNIGAYDVDLSRFVDAVECVNLVSGEVVDMSRRECEFEYRNSVFKKNPGTWMVTTVTLELPKTFVPVLTYKSLQDKLGSPTSQFTAKEVMEAVIGIRESKLPDPNVVGTAGSFFGNPKVDEKILKKLKSKYPDMPVFQNYGTDEHTIPAGWLIDNCRLDKKIRSDFLYDQHALVVVNKLKGGDVPLKYGKQIHHAAKMIMNRVEKDFGIRLSPEVVVI